MGVIKRVRDLTAATLNERLEQAEDPVRMIDGYLLEQAEQIRVSERLLQQVRQHLAVLRQQTDAAQQSRDKREQQALLAIKAGEDQLARLALQEKLLHEEKYEQYRKLYEQTGQSVLELESELAELKADYQEVYNKREYYMARMESLRLQQRMNAQLNKPGTRGGASWFQRLEERVSDLELEAGSLREVRRMGADALRVAGESLQQTLDRELAALRRKLDEEGAGKR